MSALRTKQSFVEEETQWMAGQDAPIELSALEWIESLYNEITEDTGKRTTYRIQRRFLDRLMHRTEATSQAPSMS